MTIEELYNKLKDIGINDNKIYLHGLFGDSSDDEKLSMTIKRGKYSLIWEVYFRERGEKHSVGEFNNEHDACEYYLKKMEKYQKYV